MKHLSLFSKEILACFLGSLIALTLFVGIAYGIDEIVDNHDTEKIKPLNERVLAYFDEKGIPYEEIDTMVYAFTYNETRYIYFYNPNDSVFLHITSPWETNNKDHNTLLEIANKLAWEWKFIKIYIDDENNIRFSIEQLVDSDVDIDEAFSRCLTVLEKTTGEFFDQLR
jgi:hypothetical protein